MALANQNTSFDSGKQLSVMQNWVTHGRKTQDTSNTSGSIYGGRLLSVNQNTDNIVSGKQALSTNIVMAFFGGKKVFRENKLGTEVHQCTVNIYGGISLCPKNVK